MKNQNQERMRKASQSYCIEAPWRLSKEGVYVPHCYSEPRVLSWWDDFGFKHGSQRIMVWWRHPRHVFMDKIEELAWELAGPRPTRDDDFISGNKKIYKKVGNSRKKVEFYEMDELSKETEDYFARYRSHRDRLMEEGIDHEVSSSLKMEQGDWCRRMYLTCPFELLNESDVVMAAQKIKEWLSVLKEKSPSVILAKEFPMTYGKTDWIHDQKIHKEYYAKK